MEDMKMQNIIEICKEFGLEIPDDKQKEFTSKVAENYTTKAEVDKKLGKLEADRDKWKAEAETSAETLKGFEGKDFEEIEKSRKEWEDKYNALIKAQEEEKLTAEFNEAVESAIANAKGKNAKSIIANLDIEALKASKNRDKDIENAIKALAESDDTAFLFESDPENNRARFSEPRKNGEGGARMTKKDIMAISDRAERRKAIKENMHLFEGAEE